MALPLLGMLALAGGGSYLMNKQDERKFQERRGAMENYIQDNPWLANRPDMQENLRAGMDQIESQGSWYTRPERNAGMNQLANMAQSYTIQEAGRQMQAEQAQANWEAQHQLRLNQDARAGEKHVSDMRMADLNYKTGQLDYLMKQQDMTEQDLDQYWQTVQIIQDDYRAAEQEFGEVQKRTRLLDDILQDSSMSGVDAYGAIVNLIKVMNPTEAVMQGDWDTVINAGGKSAQLAMWLKSWDSGQELPDNWRRDVQTLVGRVYDQSYSSYMDYFTKAQEATVQHKLNWNDVRSRRIDREWRPSAPSAPRSVQRRATTQAAGGAAPGGLANPRGAEAGYPALPAHLSPNKPGQTRHGGGGF